MIPLIKLKKFLPLLILALTLILGTSTCWAEIDKPLAVNEAFQLSAMLDKNDNQQFTLHWKIAPDYHLYSDAIHVKVLAPSNTILADYILPTGKPGDDASRGSYMEYYQQLDIPIKVTHGTAKGLQLAVSYQGCADAGLCYPPQTKTMTVGENAGSEFNNLISDSTDANRIGNLLQQQNHWLALLSFFIFGVLLSFTPCVFPMIPILSSIIAGHGEHITTRKAFLLSLIYVVSAAVTYAIAGIFAGLAGRHLQSMLENPWVIGLSGLLFVVLALSLFGFYELQLPHNLQNKLSHFSHKQKTGSLYGVAIMGILSSLVVSPCVSAPLVGALAYIGQTGSAVFGGLALLIMGLGMGLPLLIVGASAGKLLPRAGGWMNSVKAVFGVILLGMAIWMWSRILPTPITLALLGILAIISAVQLGAVDATDKGWPRLWKGLGIILGIYGLFLFVGAASGSSSMFEPLAKLFNDDHQVQCSMATVNATENLNFQKIQSLDELTFRLSQAKQQKIPTLVDFYADWCIACQQMKRNVFTDPKVIAAINKAHLQLLEVDLTQTTPETQAILDQYKVIAPPSFIFFDNQGRFLVNSTIVGEQNSDDFIEKLTTIHFND